jgi:hypothetical protein
LMIADEPVEDEMADETFDTLLDRVEEALSAPSTLIEPVAVEPEPVAVEPEPEPQPEPVAIEATSPAPEPAAPAETTRPFEQTEWDLLREIVLRFERPAPFNQIHNALRDARNSAGITRTNEELRTLIKQAINSGLLERSGKGNHIVYRVASTAAAPIEPQDAGETPDQAEMIEATQLAADQPEFHTPEAEAQAALATAEPIVAPPTVITAEDTAVAETTPAPRRPSRSRRKPAATQPAPDAAAPTPAAEETPAKATRTRRKKAEPVAQAPAPVAEVPAEAAPAKARRTRRKKTENAE